jgi:protein-tyrosine phosphatase
MFANVLIVCHANVCRSPAAEMLFKARQCDRTAAPVSFQSAGLRALDGEGMDPVMHRLLRGQGIAAAGHRARRLTRRIMRAADLILVTERQQVRQVEALDPLSRGKVYSLGQWEDADVVDPHGGQEATYRDSLVHIEHLVMGWLKKIC